MSTKKAQFNHWNNCKYKNPTRNKLELLWNRAGIRDDKDALRIYRLELVSMGYVKSYKYV